MVRGRAMATLVSIMMKGAIREEPSIDLKKKLTM